jgi:hypothetical protein
MCNLYSLTTNQEAIRRLARVMIDNTGNMRGLRATLAFRAGLGRMGRDAGVTSATRAPR